MIKKMISLGLMLCIVFTSMAQKKKTTLSAEIYGFKYDMIYFDCTQTPFIRSEFHTNPGEEHLYTFETDQIVEILINGRNHVILQPGDSLHVNMTYEGKAVSSMEFTGTDKAVAANRMLWDIMQVKRELRYKGQLLACAALDIKPKQRVDDSNVLLKRVNDMLAKAGDQLTKEAALYMLSEVESDVFTSFMEYPVMYADIRKVPIDKQGIGEYWKIMDGQKLRDDKVSLRNPKYISLLMRYSFFLDEKKAVEQGKKYTMPGTLEDMYKVLSSSFVGAQRDAVLYTVLSNFIRNGKEIERAEPLLKDYKAKYNQNKEYAQILDSLMQ